MTGRGLRLPPGPLRGPVLLGAAVGVVLLHGLLALSALEHGDPAHTRIRVLHAVPHLLGGLWLLARHPLSRVGPLLLLYGGACLVQALSYTDVALLHTLGLFFLNLSLALLAHLVLSHPHGRLRTRLDRALVAAIALVGLPFDLNNAMFRPCPPGDRHCATNLAHVADRPEVLQLLFTWVLPVACLLGLGICVRWLVVFARSTGAERRALVPLLPPVVVVWGLGMLHLLAVRFLPPFAAPEEYIGPVQDLVLVVLPLSLAWGVHRSRVRAQRVGDLVVALSELPEPARLQERVRRALDDPTVRVGVWRPGVQLYEGADGLPLDPPDESRQQAATYLDREDGAGPLAVVVHDAALHDDEALLAAVTAALRLAVHNDQLQSELALRLRELEESRTRVLGAVDDARRELGQQLRDGPQRAFGQVLDDLDAACRDVPTHVREELAGTLTRVRREVQAAQEELAALAAGVYPAVLTDGGLGAALQTLPTRAGGTVTVQEIPTGRYPVPVEAAAWFVVAEGLANAGRHAAGADVHVAVAARDEGRSLEVRVRDTGPGGARPRPGGGLAGLADRVAALGGSLSVSSPPGGGTTLVARFPVGAGTGAPA